MKPTRWLTRRVGSVWRLISLAIIGIRSKCVAVVAVKKPSKTCQIPGLDQIIMDRFQVRHGSFVEVGAFDGERFSNTSWLADNGWRGIYIEPSSEFARHCRVRHRFNRVAVVCCAAGNEDSVVPFMQAGAISTISLETFQQYDRLPWARKLVKRKLEQHETRIQTLDALLREQNCQVGFELLVVDVEGYEENVFEGFDIRYWRPKLMIVELHDDHPDFQSNAPLVASAKCVRTKILDAGYIEVYRDDINTIFEISGWLAQAKLDASPPLNKLVTARKTRKT